MDRWWLYATCGGVEQDREPTRAYQASEASDMPAAHLPTRPCSRSCLPFLPLVSNSWRVEAEVKMELERLRANGGAEAAAAGAGAAGGRMAEELAAAKARVAALEGDVSKWEAALAARDVELQNLQRALGAWWAQGSVGAGLDGQAAVRMQLRAFCLCPSAIFSSSLSLDTIHGFHSVTPSNPPLAAGELSYESDAAERLRSELRAMQVLAGTVLMPCQTVCRALPALCSCQAVCQKVLGGSSAPQLYRRYPRRRRPTRCATRWMLPSWRPCGSRRRWQQPRQQRQRRSSSWRRSGRARACCRSGRSAALVCSSIGMACA